MSLIPFFFFQPFPRRHHILRGESVSIYQYLCYTQLQPHGYVGSEPEQGTYLTIERERRD